MNYTGFVAYPESSGAVEQAIHTAVELSEKEKLGLEPWESVPIIGFKLDDLIRDQICEADVLVADITQPNHNVFYEIGYAIASGKPIVLTVNTAIKGAVHEVQTLGLFDTTGWLTYENGEDLSIKLRKWNNVSWSNLYDKKRDHSQPLFILDTLKKTDFRNHIFHAVENSQVEFRKFDPDEVPRLTAAQSIAEASASAGIIIPLIGEDIVDAHRHNLRAAFILGLAHGYDIEPLAIQYEQKPAPLDYRDFIKNSTFRGETERHVEGYCAETLILNQRSDGRARRSPPGILGKINLGSSSAENESQTLGRYFVETAEYSRALRAEGAIIIGRKGSGKSAVFQQVAKAVSKDRSICIVELRPASHNLSEMREELLSVVQTGVFEHTVAAFWQYILYVEVLLKIREICLPRSKNDFELQERIRKIEDEFSLTESVVSGDFTSRLDTVVQEIVQTIQGSSKSVDLRKQLTNLLFEQHIPKLRDAVFSFQDQYSNILVLIDDLDKGWPPRRVEKHDVVTIRHLIEVLNHISRDIGKRNIGLRHLVFLRSDIYEKLVEQTSDRGKYNVVKLDWSDSDQLCHLLRKRIDSEIDPAHREQAWDSINPSIGPSDAVSLMIEHSLRRPRFLIDLCERVLSFAVNRGHDNVTEADVRDGIRQMSLYLVSDFGYELRDVAGTPEDIFYHFIGAGDLLTTDEIAELLKENEFGLSLSDTIELLVWYGFLGVISESKPVFIYDLAYDFRRLQAERPSDTNELLYAVNPAFIEGLNK